MSWLSPIGMIILGGFLVILGFLVIFLMVIRVIEPSFILNFAGYAASFAGLVFGLIGISQYTTRGRGDF